MNWILYLAIGVLAASSLYQSYRVYKLQKQLEQKDLVIAGLVVACEGQEARSSESLVQLRHPEHGLVGEGASHEAASEDALKRYSQQVVDAAVVYPLESMKLGRSV